ncbi:ATP-dependent DNA ligase [Rhizobium azooxidifex]|uniref:ATP-dependent DNA ligase n=1 Tax=Mycoplana azooxidifex TaxID=1636188 RepID=A0A7W6DBG5_9HYPH|nr:ATP-dependent DNA ligase [Mycoplana azooxidifex]
MKQKRRSAIPLYDESGETLQSRPVRKRDPEQPSLPFDPMPQRVEPCLALLRPTPPEGPEWLYEIKWDGHRLAIHIEPNAVRIITAVAMTGHIGFSRLPKLPEARRRDRHPRR